MSVQTTHCHQVLASAEIGGAEKVALTLHGFMSAQPNVTSRLLVPSGGAAERLACDRNLAHRRYRAHWLTKGNWLETAATNLGLWAGVAGRSRQILHFHSPFIFGSTRLLRRLAPAAKTVVHVHLDYPAQALEWPLAAPPDLLILCAKSLEPIVSSAMATTPATNGCPRVRILQNAVDVSRFPPVEKKAAKMTAGFDPATPLALMVANLAKHKGQETALRMAALLRGQGVSLRLAFVGEERGGGTEFTSRLQAMTDALGVRSMVDFLGFRTDVPQLLGAADFLLLPSTSEALPLTILEAQAAKAVVLAAPTADIPDVVQDGTTGFLIPADDPQGYAQRIAALIATPSLIETIADHARTEVVRRFDLQAYCQAVLSEYEALFQ